jgi:hypothetical protein
MLRSEEVGRDRDGKGAAFVGVGGGAELVEEDERSGVGEAREPVEIDDVRRKGRKRLLNGLGVADVSEECGEDGEGRGCGRHGNTGLGHEGAEGRGFERDGLAAGVGAGDDQLAG